MVDDVNWWLMALSFLLGLVLTFAFMIRRVTREVPIYAALGRGPGVDAGVAKPAAAGPAAEAAKAAGLAGGEEPYGKGSLRVAKGSVAPAGYTIKGNEDSMLYHTKESPSYEQTIAEIWFIDEASAEAAGFKKYK